MRIKITSYDVFNDRFSVVMTEYGNDTLETVPAVFIAKYLEQDTYRTTEQPETFIGYEFEI